MQGNSARWLVVGLLAFGLGVAGGRAFKKAPVEQAARSAGQAKPLGSALTDFPPGTGTVVEQPELAARIEFLERLTAMGLDELPDLVRQLAAELDRGSPRYGDLNFAIDRWIELDPAGGFEFFLAEFPDVHGRNYRTSMFAGRWAMVDPDAALAACEKSAPKATGSVIAALATHRPADFFRLRSAKSPGNYYLAVAAQKLARADPPAMLAALRQLDENSRKGVIADLAVGWAGKDFDMAVAWVRGLEVDDQIRARAFRALAMGLIDEDPERAAELYLEGGSNGGEIVGNTIAFEDYSGRSFNWVEMAERYAVKDPLAAFEWAQAFAENQNAHTHVAACAPASASATIDYFSKLPDAAFETATPIYPPYSWQPSDVDEAFERITELSNPAARETAYRWILPELAKTDPEAAIAASTEHLQTPRDRERILQSAMERWGTTDPEAASTWLTTQEPGTDRDAAIRGLIEASKLADPAAALEWSRQISDEKERDWRTAQILMSQPRALALSALDSLGLSEAERAQMEVNAYLLPKGDK